MAETFTSTRIFAVITCYKCGIEFGAPSYFQEKRREDQEDFWCPNGHRQHYTKSTAERFQEQIAAKDRELARERQRHDQTSAQLRDTQTNLDTTSRRLSATRGVVTRTKNRIAKGICPCCNRHFENLQRHMTSQHPEYTTEQTDG